MAMLNNQMVLYIYTDNKQYECESTNLITIYYTAVDELRMVKGDIQ